MPNVPSKQPSQRTDDRRDPDLATTADDLRRRSAGIGSARPPTRVRSHAQADAPAARCADLDDLPRRITCATCGSGPALRRAAPERRARLGVGDHGRVEIRARARPSVRGHRAVPGRGLRIGRTPWLNVIPACRPRLRRRPGRDDRAQVFAQLLKTSTARVDTVVSTRAVCWWRSSSARRRRVDLHGHVGGYVLALSAAFQGRRPRPEQPAPGIVSQIRPALRLHGRPDRWFQGARRLLARSSDRTPPRR